MLPVMIVEDEKYLLELYIDELQERGFAVRSATTGKEALESIRKDRPGLVILDIKLQDMEGLKVLEEIKAIDKTIPVILNSAYSVYKSDFSSWMADDYIIKSSDLTELIEKVKRYIGN